MKSGDLAVCNLVLLSFLSFRCKPCPWLVGCNRCFNDCRSSRQRHSLQRDMWSCLPGPERAYVREIGLLEAELELPQGNSYHMHPLWQETCETLQFSSFGPIQKVKSY